MLYNGQPSKYALRLMSEYGSSIIQELESLRQKITKDFPYELKIEEYNEKVRQLSF
jgi:hypothetical protein